MDEPKSNLLMVVSCEIKNTLLISIQLLLFELVNIKQLSAIFIVVLLII
jgi:hypothetical protein